jgi:6-pyruvoyltetrahydropterin/6-carboxytetrahydropterin synthase
VERYRGTGGGSYTVAVEDSFSAAHALAGYDGDCEHLHGHNWTVKVTVCGERLDAIGVLMDFRELKKLLRAILAELDHSNLSLHPVFSKTNPSAENIAKYIYDKLFDDIKKHGCELTEVAVSETPNSTATYRP